MKKLFSFLLFFCLFSSVSLYAQTVAGHWYGVGKVDLPGSSNSYMSELILTQKGKQVTGLFNYYFRDSLFSNKVTGIFDAATRRLVINPTTLIHHSSSSTVTGIDCPMSGEFLLRVARAESVLTGIMVSNKDYRFTCPPVNFKLKIGTDSIAVQPQQPAKVDTVKPKPIRKEIVPNSKNAQFAKRAKNYIREIEVTSDVLQLEFYDNGSIDNDSITVFFNDSMVVSKAMLNYKAITVNVTMDDNLDFNELAMFAESVGTIPPNTALLVIHDGNKRYDVLMSSDFEKTATIKLVRKKE